MISGYGDDIPSFRGSRFIKHPTNLLGKRKSKKKITHPNKIDLSCAIISNIPCKKTDQPESKDENLDINSIDQESAVEIGDKFENVKINSSSRKHQEKKKRDFEKFSQRCQKKKKALKFKMNIIRMQTKIDEMSELISGSIHSSTLSSNFLFKHQLTILKLLNCIFILAAIVLYIIIFCLGKDQLFGWSSRQVIIHRHHDAKIARNIFGTIKNSLSKFFK